VARNASSLSSQEEVLEFLRDQHKFDPPNISSNSKLVCVGDSSFSLSCIQTRVPAWIIPTAPSHVMKDLILAKIKVELPKIRHTLVFPGIHKQDLPSELFLFGDHSPDMYLSYAAWDERCPDKCPAPLGYCSVHQRKKPFTVTDVIKNWQHSQSRPGVFFHSVQLFPGLGGIAGDTFQTEKWEEVLQSLSTISSETNGSANLPFFISTSCHCHGVVSGVSFTEESPCFEWIK
ncbi:MAG: hypothetical protein ACTSYI_00355, partial [Promethearchaeota archaeon]